MHTNKWSFITTINKYTDTKVWFNYYEIDKFWCQVYDDQNHRLGSGMLK